MSECPGKCPYDGVIASMQAVLERVSGSLDSIDKKLDTFCQTVTEMKVHQEHHKDTLGRVFTKIEQVETAHNETKSKVDGYINKGKGALTVSSWAWTGITAMAGVVWFVVSHITGK